MKAFFDSSAFAKRYIEENGSAVADEICMATDRLGLSVICLPEIISALNRRLREKAITREQYAQAKQLLSEDVRDADIIDITPEVIGQSIVRESAPAGHGRAASGLRPRVGRGPFRLRGQSAGQGRGTVSGEGEADLRVRRQESAFSSQNVLRTRIHSDS